MNGYFELVGVLAILAAVGAYQCVDAIRWRDARRFALSLVASLALASAAGLGFWSAPRNPPINIWGNWGFGPDWECANAPQSARVCFRDVPPRLQDRPATAPKPVAASTRN